MATRIIAAVSAAYKVGDVVEWANQGDEVDLSPEDEKLLEEQGALVPAHYDSFTDFSSDRLDAYRAGRGDVEAAQRIASKGMAASMADTSGGITDLSAPSGVAALGEYLRANKPNADDTVALAQGNAVKAKEVLEAEKLATEGEPRKSVAEPLERIIEGGEEV